MENANQNSRRCCKICSVSFKTHSELAKHCLDTNHQRNQCCQRCIRWFPSKQALEQHDSAKHAKEPEALTSQGSSTNASTAVPLLQFRFKDKSYKRSPLLDSTVIYDLLTSKCHSSDRLGKEGYILPSMLRQESRKDRTAPFPSSLEPKRKAVALDCEMAGVRNRSSEIISICVIDFFSGQVLIDSLVKPHEQIIEWRTNIHGIRPATMSIAVSQEQVLHGWEAARHELFKHINSDTVLVGQSLHQDLNRLRISHEKIFDTAIITAEKVFGTNAGFGRRWSLQSLCADLLGLRIRHGSNTHEALEDSMAAREIALWCLCYPDKLEQWGKSAREEYMAAKLKKAKDKQKKRRNVQRPARVRNGGSDDCEYHHHCGCDGHETLRWEDVIDWDMWPKSPPSD